MPRTYKNNSGVYEENQLVVAVWFNSKKSSSRPNARRLETFTTSSSYHPIAFPLETLRESKSWMYCPVAKDSSDLNFMLEPGQATKDKPVLVPLTLAKSHLGWQDFYIPSEYTEIK